MPVVPFLRSIDLQILHSRQNFYFPYFEVCPQCIQGFVGLTLWEKTYSSAETTKTGAKSFPASQFKSINSSVFSFLYSPTITYITTGKTIALTRRSFVGKVMSLLLNILSRLVTTFLPRSKHLLISWLKSPFAVILEPKK